MEKIVIAEPENLLAPHSVLFICSSFSCSSSWEQRPAEAAALPHKVVSEPTEISTFTANEAQVY